MMTLPHLDKRTAAALDTLASTVAQWEQSHPAATLSALEGALDTAWSQTRADLIATWAQAQPAARLAGQPAERRPRCPTCDTPLVAEGRQRRTLTLTGDQPLELERDYARCPACGQGLFPPG